jgi:aminomethyltransferase
LKPNPEVLVSPPESLLETPLYSWHQANGGRLVEFGGWSMPVQYTTIVDEHKAVRERVGLFDISHMGRLTFDGSGVLDWLERVTTNHVARLDDLQIQYSLLATDQGGVIDDILVYRQPFAYIVVCNASNRDPVKARFEALRQGAVGNFVDRTLDTAMIAVQGPKALETLQPLFEQRLDTVPYYHFTMGQLRGGVNTVLSRTGYTGEDGFEVVVARNAAVDVWNALLETGKSHGIQPCGLGARDTLRLEAAMPLYGHELSESINPFAAGVGWAVKLDKGDFAGRTALKDWKDSPGLTRVGLKLESKRIARHGAIVFSGDLQVGEVTSGTFSPTLETSLAMALVDPKSAAKSNELAIDVRGHREPARVVKLPFYKRSRGVTRAG